MLPFIPPQWWLPQEYLKSQRKQRILSAFSIPRAFVATEQFAHSDMRIQHLALLLLSPRNDMKK
jgi:hypothetical protein